MDNMNFPQMFFSVPLCLYGKLHFEDNKWRLKNR
jgi:hypothetical protein